MINLKTQLESLREETISEETREICNKYIKRLIDVNTMGLTESFKTEFETKLLSEVLDELGSVSNDKATQNFIVSESSKNSLNILYNLGVRKAIREIKNSDAMENPTITYKINEFEKIDLPEFMIAEDFVATMHNFEWHEVIKNNLDKIRKNARLHEEEFKIYKNLFLLENSRSQYILSGVKPLVESYLKDRTKISKDRLLEKLNVYSFDTNVKMLINSISESNKFNSRGDTNTATSHKIFSPVLISENSEYFGISGKIYKKQNGKIENIDESVLNSVSEKSVRSFVHLVKLFNNPAVDVSESRITLYGGNRRKVDIVLNENDYSLFLNDNKISLIELNKTLSSTGGLRHTDHILREHVEAIVENLDTIVELDFAKTIKSKVITGKSIDVMKVNENIFVYKNDPSGLTDKPFLINLNATQTKNLVKEFLNYDLTHTFKDMLNEEEAEIEKMNEIKREYVKSISNLEMKFDELNNIQDSDILESEEYIQIVKLLKEEIFELKKEYSDFMKDFYEKTNITNVNEEGFTITVNGKNIDISSKDEEESDEEESDEEDVKKDKDDKEVMDFGTEIDLTTESLTGKTVKISSGDIVKVNSENNKEVTVITDDGQTVNIVKNDIIEVYDEELKKSENPEDLEDTDKIIVKE